jgi:two-component system, OmpR family, sensor kinase
MRRWWLALIPLALGAVITGISIGAGDARTLVSQSAIAWLWLTVGAVASVAVLAIMLVGHRIRRAEALGRQRGAADQRENQDRLLTRLDHELKNPITAILAAVSNLNGDEPAVASIQSQAGRLSRLLTDLRKLAEVRSVQLELAPVDLAALCAEVRDAVAAIPGGAGRSISLGFPRAPRPLPTVRADADLLFLALYNVVSNAVKYSSDNDAIEVRGMESDGQVVIEIADTGMGIPNEEQSLVWEELSRGSGALTIPGSGLGLPFVRAIIDRHGGTVRLASRVGEGTLVSVVLPLESTAG